MWRSLFIALGITCVLLGVECLLIDKAILNARPTTSGGMLGGMEVGGRKEIVPPEWAPWSLISAGVVTMLYSFTLPKRVGGGH